MWEALDYSKVWLGGSPVWAGDTDFGPGLLGSSPRHFPTASLCQLGGHLLTEIMVSLSYLLWKLFNIWKTLCSVAWTQYSETLNALLLLFCYHYYCYYLYILKVHIYISKVYTYMYVCIHTHTPHIHWYILHMCIHTHTYVHFTATPIQPLADSF